MPAPKKEEDYKRWITKLKSANNSGQFRKGHRVIKGSEKGWIKKGQRLSPETEFKSRGKNGRYKVKASGYILVYSPKHPNKTSADCVFEHRLEVEKYLGRYLTKDQVVHHINHIKDDNNIKNLEVINKKEHSKLHWDSIKKKFTTMGTKCNHSDIMNIKKIDGKNKWLEVGYCVICNKFVYVNSPEDVWRELKI